ncbi:hypothetical protein BD410DRAFT_51815 [Rickenella mellea]|uniref:Uncharacterized protein n=1 Tax=Rickenella mellea TaxID=50990 RepID=A0A4R5XIC7_9AGAM|nr:hypothetical protein BD410DRAFT_51815 [Rickenella mellea]
MHHIGNRDSPSFRRLITTTCLGVEPDQRLSLLRPRRPSDRQLHLFVNFTDILTGLVKLALDDAVSMSARKIRLCLSALSLILGRGQLGAEGHRYLNVDAKVHDPTREYPGYYVINSDREVSFDQMLRFHIKQWQVATSSTPRGATLILAIGNGTFSKINDVEVFGNLRSMLQKGWRVELFAWDRSLYKIWEDEFGGVGLPWAGRFTLTKLDQFAAELVDISDGERLLHMMTCAICLR